MCEAGKSVECTTSCGSKGTGMCSAECAVPSAEQCTAPQETCNWKDDDCDGLVDEGLLVQDPAATHVWTHAGATGNGLGSVSLLPREQGIWLLRGPSNDILSGQPGAVRAVQLGANGEPALGSFPLVGTETTTRFLADSHGKWIVVLADHHEGTLAYLRLHVFKDTGAALSPAGEYDLFRAELGVNQCVDLKPIALSVLEGQADALHIALVQGKSVGTIAGSSCAGPALSAREIDGMFLTRNGDGTWSAPRKPTEVGWLRVPGGPGAVQRATFDVQTLVRLPCRSEWLFSYRRDGREYIKRISATGEELASRFEPYVDLSEHLVFGLSRRRCDAPRFDVPIVSLFASASGTRETRLYYWRVDDQGIISKRRSSVALPVLEQAALTSAGPRTLLVGVATAQLKVLDISGEGEPKEMSLQTISEVGSAGDRAVAAADSGSSIVVAASKSYGAALDNFPQYKEPNDTAPAVAVSYAFTCPK